MIRGKTHGMRMPHVVFGRAYVCALMLPMCGTAKMVTMLAMRFVLGGAF
jgi:hypothetical protein